MPVAVETFGAWGSQGLKLIKEIGRRIQDVTSEKRLTFYLLPKSLFCFVFNRGGRNAKTGSEQGNLVKPLSSL